MLWAQESNESSNIVLLAVMALPFPTKPSSVLLLASEQDKDILP